MKLLSATAGLLAAIFFLSTATLAAGSSDVSATSAAKAEPAEYAIKFARPFKVGDVYQLSLVQPYKVESRTTSPGRTPTLSSRTDNLELKGTVEVLGVDANGRPNKVRFTVAKAVYKSIYVNWTADLGKPANVNLSPGSIFVIEPPPPTDYFPIVTPNDPNLKLTPDDKAALGRVLSSTPFVAQTCGVFAGAGSNYDDVAGPVGKQKVGASWNLKPGKDNLGANLKSLTDNVAALMARLEKTTNQGHATLKRAVKIAGADWLEILLEIKGERQPTSDPKRSGKSTETLTQTILILADPAVAGEFKLEDKYSDQIFSQITNQNGLTTTTTGLATKTTTMTITMKKK